MGEFEDTWVSGLQIEREARSLAEASPQQAPLTTGERLGALVFMYKKDSGGLIPNPLNSCEYSGNGSQFMPDNSPWQHRSEAEAGGQRGLVERFDKPVRSRDG